MSTARSAGGVEGGVTCAGAGAGETSRRGTSSEPASVAFAFTGPLGALAPGEMQRLVDRGSDGRAVADLSRSVAAIIEDVRSRGDESLRELAARHDGVVPDPLEVPRREWDRALARMDGAVRSALEEAAANIAAFHRTQLPVATEVEVTAGIRLGRVPEPLRRVGVYAPGGRAAYPSSVLMGVIPARVAGVDDVLVCSPPGPDGLPPDTVLAACALAGADRVFAVGGAGAVAALALGTETVPRVDAVVGPGNAYVTEAKRQLNGIVRIDSPAGPSEVLVIADETADPDLIAAELLAQAEHDPDAAAVLVTTHAPAVADVMARVEGRLADEPRADTIRQALAARGGLLVAANPEAALAFAEAYAPEHLIVMTRQPRDLLPALRRAGTVFLGGSSSVAFGDYITGANHVLPTAGAARAWSGLSTLSFMRWTTYQELTPAAAARLAAPTATLAIAEGLPAHARAALMRAGDPAAGDASREPPADPAARAAAAPPAARTTYGALALYDPGRTPCDVDLSDNTNLFGPAPSVRRAVEAAGDTTLTRYPSVYATELKRALADLHGVAPENIATGCGSDDVIDSALRAFGETGDAVAFPDPTFGMVAAFGRMNGLEAAPVPLTTALELDAGAILATHARVTYVCRPNNPTGTLFRRDDVESVCRGAAGLVLVDEAYADFAEDDMVGYATASDRTVVLRTLSKAYGLAGLRVGYAVGPAALIREIEKSRGPYKVGGLAEAAALAVLRHDAGWISDRIDDVRSNRERLRKELRRRDMPALSSDANFVLLPVPGSAARWDRALRSRGVGTRPFAGLSRVGDCLRVSIGPWPLLQRFLDALDAVRSAESQT
ncbi:MAG TPA: histidinol dehydrogenase [Longimicrobiales bacterium]|nr:histidinol dehydrogenase [Longimicrobiales bacterium]